MNRRTVLGAIGTGLTALSGCLSTADGRSPSDPATGTPPATPESTPPVNTGGLDEFDPASTSEEVAVGSRDGVPEQFGPHDLIIWNAHDRERTVSVRILDRVANATAHRATYDIPSNAAVEIALLTPAKYYVQLWGPAIDSPETLLVPCGLFDCNASATRIGLFASGRVRSSVISTAAGCPEKPEC